MLDGSYAFTQLIPENVAATITSSGKVYTAEYDSTSQQHDILAYTILPDIGATSEVSVQDVDFGNFAEDDEFDANTTGEIAYSHSSEYLGSVISVQHSAGSITTLALDSIPPEAWGGRPSYSFGGTTLTFAVNFRETGSYLDRQSSVFDGSEILISGPFQLTAEPYSVSVSDGDWATVKYAVRAPDGGWDSTENGEYTIEVIGGSVADVAGNGIAPTTLETFTVGYSSQADEVDDNYPDEEGVQYQQDDGYQWVVENRQSIQFLSSAEVADETWGISGSVAISENGTVAVAGSSIWVWQPRQETVVFQDLSNLEWSSPDSVQVADNGRAAILTNEGDQLLTFEPDAGVVRLVETDVAAYELDHQGDHLLFSTEPIISENIVVSAMYLYDVGLSTNLSTNESPRIHRLIGTWGDGSLDPGERWHVSDGGEVDVDGSYFPALATPVGIYRDDTNLSSDRPVELWAVYQKREAYPPDPDGLVVTLSDKYYAIRIAIDAEGNLEQSTPVLLAAYGFENQTGGGVAAVDLQQRQFHLLHRTEDAMLTSQEPIPDLEAEHAELDDAEFEKLAREIAYWELRDPNSQYQIGTVLENGYVVEGMYRDGDQRTRDKDVQGTFEAVVLEPTEKNSKRPPVIAFRGSDPDDLTTTVFEKEGVGYSHFQQMKPWVLDATERLSERFDTPVAITGHSLGGALSQWFAAAILSETDHNLHQIVTFNSPGISSFAVESIKDEVSRIAKGITHHVAIGDFVSLAGERFIDGNTRLYHIQNENIVVSRPIELNKLWDSQNYVPRHTHPLLNKNKQVQYQEDSLPKLDIGRVQTFPNAVVLNHPEFNYLKDPAYVSFLSIVHDKAGKTADYLVSRQRAEAARVRFRDLQAVITVIEGFFESDPGVFTSIDIDQINQFSESWYVGFDYSNAELVVSANAPLIAAVSTTGGNFISYFLGGSLNSYENQGPAVTPIRNSERAPGRYQIYHVGFPGFSGRDYVSTGSFTIVGDSVQPTLVIGDVAINETEGIAEFTVIMTPAPSSVVNVSYMTADGTATAGDDYLADSGILSFSPSKTVDYIQVAIVDDDLVEEPEHFLLSLSSLDNVSIAEPNVVGLINDNDNGRSSISISDMAIFEDNEEGVFTVSVSPISTEPITVGYASSDDTAVAGLDYQAITNTLTIPANSPNATIRVPLIDDQETEDFEFFVMTLSSPTNASLGKAEGRGTILDDDGESSDTVSVTIDDVTVDETAGVARFTVTVTPTPTDQVTISFQTVNGTAVSGVDYAASSGSLDFTNSKTQDTIEVSIVDDDEEESSENFFVSLTSSDDVTFVKTQGIGTITANDSVESSVSVDDVTIDENAGDAIFTVSVSPVSSEPITVSYASSDGTAVAGLDYQAVADSLTIPANAASATIRVPLIDDQQTENLETFVITLSSPTSATLGKAQGTGTILDDDEESSDTVSVTINDVTVDEAGGVARFTVSVTPAPTDQVTISFQTINGTAVSGSDYVPSSGSLEFTNSKTQDTIEVSIVDDDEEESSENFFVSLTSSDDVTFVRTQGIGTITANDSIDSVESFLSINDVTIDENAGDAVFTVSVSPVSTEPITVSYASQDGTAVAGLDYQAVADTLTIPANAPSATIRVPLIDDQQTENLETFAITLSSPTNATLGKAEGTGTILDDDDESNDTVSVTIDDLTVDETAGVARFTVTLTPAPTDLVTISFQTAEGTAVSGSDYVASSGSLEFTNSKTQDTIEVSIVDDDEEESSENFFVSLTSSNDVAFVRTQGLGTIVDDDELDVEPDGTGTIAGRKWYDADRNGQREPNERWLNDWTIQLVDSSGDLVAEAVTADIDLDQDGSIDEETERGWYTFEVLPGTYSIREVLRPDWIQTAPAEGLLNLAQQLDSHYAFEQTGSDFQNWGGLGEKWIIGAGSAWFFITPDGALYEWNGSNSQNLSGTKIASLSPEFHANLDLITAPNVSDFGVTVIAGQSVDGPDFGNFNLLDSVAISGRKLHDANGNGQFDSGETWLNGVAIELTDKFGAVVAQTETQDRDLNGNGQIEADTEAGWYSFMNLTPGSWSVRALIQEGWEATGFDQHAQQAFEFKTDRNIRYTGESFENWGGRQERWLRGTDDWYFVTPNGVVYQWDGNSRDQLTGERVAILTSEYYNDMSLIYNADDPSSVAVTAGVGDNLVADLTSREKPTTNPIYVGNVSITLTGNNVLLQGDSAHNGIRISENDEGTVSFTGIGNTTVNEQTEFSIDSVGNLTIRLGGGDDLVVINGISTTADLVISSGTGDDIALLDSVSVGGRYLVSDVAGDNTMHATNLLVAGSSVLSMGGGNDRVAIGSSTLSGRTSSWLRGGSDIFASRDTQFEGATRVLLGAGNDELILGESVFLNTRSVILGGGGSTDRMSFVAEPTIRVRSFEAEGDESFDRVLDSLMEELAELGINIMG